MALASVIVLVMVFAGARWALRSSLVQFRPIDGHRTSTVEATLDVAHVASFGALRAARTVRLVRASFADGGEGLRIAAARVHFYDTSASRGRRDIGVFGGNACIRWPPLRWGPLASYPLEGLTLRAGEIVDITFAVLPERPGTFEANGAVITYRDGFRTRSVRMNGMSVVTLAAARAAELPKGRPNCNPEASYRYFEPVPRS